MPYEIERKWVLQQMPNLGLTPFEIDYAVEAKQGYVFTDPGEMRIRRETIDTRVTYYMSVKGDGGLVRQEWDPVIEKWVFDLVSKQVSAWVEKTRFVVSFQGLELEFDVFAGSLEGLVLLEVEWVVDEKTPEAEQIAMDFVLPDFVGPAIEVTKDARFKNKKTSKP